MSNIETNEMEEIDQPPTTGSLANLQENFNQQQAKISALKELVRQSEEDQGKNTASAQEKVRNIAQRLTHLKSKATRSRQNEKSFSEIHEENSIESRSSISGSSSSLIQNESHSELQYSLSSKTPITSRARSETPGSEKIQLLRQQMEQNRLKMAERETNKRDVEQMVSQLKQKFNSSQLSLDRAHLLGNSVGDLSALSSHGSQRHQSTGDLSGGFNLERERVKYLEKRVKHLETQVKQKEHDLLHKDPESEQSKLILKLNARVLDLEENLKEKDGVIDARTKAASLITESLSLKGKDTVDLLEETKQEMMKMQSNFVATEDEMNKRISSLEKEIQTKDKKIANLEEVADILETERFNLTLKNSELDSKTGSVEDYVNKLDELNKINETLQHRIESLENDQKDGDSTETPIDKEMLHKIQELETKIADLENENDDLKKSLQSALNTPVADADEQGRINNLEATIAAQKEELIANSELLQSVQDQLMEKTVEYNVLMANFNVLEEKLKSYGPKSLFSKSTDEEAQAEVNKLTKQLDEANKSGIKTKLKLKQLQKQIDTFKKTSDASKELVKLMEENQRLSDKLKELESENATLKSSQLQSAAEDGNEIGREASDLESKIKLLETTCQNQTSAIQLLEEQKLDMTADLNNTKTELTSLKENIKDIGQNEVTNQMDSIAYEERIEQSQRDIDELKGQINRLVAEKQDLKSKLDRCMNENMELLEKIDKLSKGSSVESIEILERLTQEEKMEMERFQEAVEKEQQQYCSEKMIKEGNESDSGENRDHTVDVTDKVHSADAHADKSIVPSDESIAKINALLEENNQLAKLIEELRAEKLRILNEFDELKANNSTTMKELNEIESEREKLLDNVKEFNDIKTKLESEIVQLKDERDAVQSNVPTSDKQSISVIAESLDDYRCGLKSLTTELDNYRNAKEKNAKVNASKKLAKQSKNVSELMEKLLTTYSSCMEEFAVFRAEIENERAAKEKHQLEKPEKGQVKEITAPIIDEAQIEKLRQEISELRDSEADYKLQYSNLEKQIEEKELSFADLERSTAQVKADNDRLNEQIKNLESELGEVREHQFQELHKQRKEFDNLVESNKKEVEILRELIDEQKQQLITAYTEQETELQEKENQIASYTGQIEKLQTELNAAQSQMQSANSEYAGELNEKIESMQKMLNENKQLLEEQSEELANKQSTIESLNQQIMDLYKSMEDTAAQLAEKDDEIEHLQSMLDKNKAEMKKMNQTCLASGQKAKELDHTLKQKEKEFEKTRSEWEKSHVELENSRAEWEKTKTELELKNKEQLDKLKKFAANLKKRNQQYAELEAKYANLEKSIETPIERVIVQEVAAPVVEAVPLQQSSNDAELEEQKNKISNLEQKLTGFAAEVKQLRDEVGHKTAELENLKLRLSEKDQLLDEITAESIEKQSQIVTLNAELHDMLKLKDELVQTTEDLKAKNIKIEKCKAVIKERNKEIKRLQEVEKSIKDKESSEASADELKQRLDALQSEKEKISTEFENYRSFIETKLQNSDLIIEEIENENAELKERIGRLEDNISLAEQRRSSLERHSEVLGLQLQQKQSQIESAEDEYSSRLKTLVGQDEIIEEKLKDLEYERDNLLVTIKEHEARIEEFKDRNSLLEQQLNNLETTKLADLEIDNRELSGRVEKLETELARKQQEFDAILAEKQTEMQDLENELSNHLKTVEKERRSIQEDLEKSREENTVLQDQLVQLQESQTNLEQSRNELEKEMTWVKLQNDTMTHDQMEAQELRMQVVHDQTEVENLHAQNVELVEKYTSEINLLQSQLHEANEVRTAAEAQVERLSVEIGLVKEELSRDLDTLRTQRCEDQTELVNLRLKNEQMTADHETEVSNLHARLVQMNAEHNELENLRVVKQQLDNEIAMMRQQISQLDALQMNVGSNITQDMLEVHQLRLQITHDQTEIESLRHQLQQLNSNHEAELAALRQQIAELDSLRMQVGQNQTDDQVFIQNENERLQTLLAEKEIEIQNYQRQNLQLQMSSGMMGGSDPFASFAPPPPPPSLDTNEAANRIMELENRLENILHESNELQARCIDLQRLSSEKDTEISRLQELIHNISSGSTESVPANEPVITSHQTQSLNVVPFDIVQASSIDVGSELNSAPQGDHGQQIEDLQRNVSDLEKYVTDLEHKLKAANEENAKHHVERVNMATRSKQYEDQLVTQHAELETMRNQLTALQEQPIQQQIQQQVHQEQQQTPEQHLPSAASLFESPSGNPFDGFGNAASDAEYAGQVSVVEETIVPKQAYLCYPEPQQQSDSPNLLTMAEGEGDGWGDTSWGNEAILEEQHQQQSATFEQIAAVPGLNRAAINLQVEIDELKAEREAAANELSALQTKYQKLLKKLREYKAKIDGYEHSKSQPQSSMSVSNDLDLAIQEELNNQIKVLEQKIAETKAEHEKDSQEKKKLLSRVDVLTAANDRMIEMKDKQDVEIEVCKTKIRELNSKLEKLNNWDDHTPSGSGDQGELAARLTDAQNQNRLLEERINRMQAAVAEKDDFEDEREQFLEQIRIFSAEKVLLEENIIIRDNEIATLKEKLKALEAENKDYRDTIEVLSDESNKIKMYLDQLKDEHKQKIDENANLSEKLKELMDKNAELAKQVDEMHVYNLSSHDVEQRIQDLNASVQYKDSEIFAFNEKFENQKQQFDVDYNRLNDEIRNNNQTITELRQEIERLTNEKNALEQERAQQPVVQVEAPNLDAIPGSNEEIRQLEKIVNELREEKVQTEAELQVLNDQVIKNLEIEDRIKGTVLELDMKNIEISELKNSLQQMNQNQSAATSTSASQEEMIALQQKLQEKDAIHQSAVDLLNAQWQQVVDQKCGELADSWRNHLQIKEDEFAQIEQELRLQLEQQSMTSTTTPEKTQNSSKSSELSSESRQQSFEQKSEEIDNDQAELIKTMQSALESQEIEIVSLKEQLAIRSAEYARIAASVDPYGTKSISSSNMYSTGERQHVEENPPKGSELDLALYMLHQRDMRCEELTEEVCHLLEERDTLQLKLSNSIRQLEESKQRPGSEDSMEASSSSPVKPTSTMEHEARSSPDSKNQSQNDNLDMKLSELHEVRHSRDKRLYEEREQRRRQMNLFQRDVANMPPEAIAELFGPDFNPAARQNQHPSSTILNWLWGKPASNEPQN